MQQIPILLKHNPRAVPSSLYHSGQALIGATYFSKWGVKFEKRKKFEWRFFYIDMDSIFNFMGGAK